MNQHQVTTTEYSDDLASAVQTVVVMINSRAGRRRKIKARQVAFAVAMMGVNCDLQQVRQLLARGVSA